MKIDVSKCKYLDGFCMRCETSCEEVSIDNCYYKQLQQLKEKNIKLNFENIHYNYLISAYHVCFEGALGAIQELLKNDCDNPKYYASVAKTYLGFRYEEQQEAKNIYDKHFAELKAEVKSKTEYIQEQRDIINQYSKEIEMYKKCQGKRASKREEELKAENKELKDFIKDDLSPTCQRLQAENEELKDKFLKDKVINGLQTRHEEAV